MGKLRRYCVEWNAPGIQGTDPARRRSGKGLSAGNGCAAAFTPPGHCPHSGCLDDGDPHGGGSPPGPRQSRGLGGTEGAHAAAIGDPVHSNGSERAPIRSRGRDSAPGSEAGEYPGLSRRTGAALRLWSRPGPGYTGGDHQHRSGVGHPSLPRSGKTTGKRCHLSSTLGWQPSLISRRGFPPWTCSESLRETKDRPRRSDGGIYGRSHRPASYSSAEAMTEALRLLPALFGDDSRSSNHGPQPVSLRHHPVPVSARRSVRKTRTGHSPIPAHPVRTESSALLVSERSSGEVDGSTASTAEAGTTLLFPPCPDAPVGIAPAPNESSAAPSETHRRRKGRCRCSPGGNRQPLPEPDLQRPGLR